MPVETTAADSYREDLVSSGVVIKTEALAKVYEMGAEQVHALRGVDVSERPYRATRTQTRNQSTSNGLRPWRGLDLPGLRR